jgi:uncharacterized membrane protein
MKTNDDHLERAVGRLLRTGVFLAAAVVLTGGFVYLSRHWAAPAEYAVFKGEPSDLSTLGGIVSDAARLQGRGIIQLGLLILIGTPVARVILALFAFAWQGDRTYVAITMLVLAILLFSLFAS